MPSVVTINKIEDLTYPGLLALFAENLIIF